MLLSTPRIAIDQATLTPILGRLSRRAPTQCLMVQCGTSPMTSHLAPPESSTGSCFAKSTRMERRFPLLPSLEPLRGERHEVITRLAQEIPRAPLRTTPTCSAPRPTSKALANQRHTTPITILYPLPTATVTKRHSAPIN